MAQRIFCPISADTLGRRILSFASGQGGPYGTILVDLEKNKVVDLLPDRQTETLACWLHQHPGTEIAARDRAGAYADGARQGAPGAIQVADRWHLLRNLTEAFLTVVDRHTAAARRVMAERNKHLASEISFSDMPRKDKPLTAAQRASQAALARRSARFDEAAALKAQGHSYQHIAKIIGAGRKTVGRWLRQGHAPVWTPPPRSSIVAPYAAYLNKRQAEGCRNASQLWREIVALGFPGKFSIVHQWLGPRRQKLPAQNTPSRVTAPLGRKLAQLLLANPTSRPEAENDFISRLFSSEPALAPATTWTGKMQALLRKKSDADIDHLLEEGEQTLLSNFVTGLRRDINATKAALTTPWTTSPVEGQISRLKMLKRTMFGRAGFLLLRARVLYPT